jgi:hypothetical protein
MRHYRVIDVESEKDVNSENQMLVHAAFRIFSPIGDVGLGTTYGTG